MKRLHAVAAALVLLAPVLFGADVSAKALRAAGLQSVREGTRYIDFELSDLRGNSRKLSDFQGKLIILNFWATWCPPCRAEMPSMERLYRKLKAEGLEIVAIDLREGANLVEPFVKEYSLTFPVLLDRDGRVGAKYGVRSIPTTYVIGRDGTVIAGRIGGQEWDGTEVETLLRALLER